MARAGLEQTVQEYYQSSDGIALLEYRRIPGVDGVIVGRSAPLRHSEHIDPQAVDEAMHEVSRSLRVIEYDGSTFEVASANSAAPPGAYMLHFSTYSSAVSTNFGNGYEFAAQAVRYPDHRHVYVASFGNGGTSPLLPEDTSYVRRTGRFTKEGPGGVQPIRSIRNLQAALEKHGLIVTDILSTDSAGGHYARALAAGMEPGQLERAFFSETSGMINLGIGRLAVGMLYTENIRNKKDNEAISPDTEKMDAAKVARFARAFNAYADTLQHIELDAKRVRMAQQVGSLWTSLCALAQGPDGRNNPVAADLNALLERQPDAAVAFGMAEADPLYESLAKSHFAAQRLLRAITVQHAEVKVIMIPGMSHAYNTHFPSFYHAVKRYALGL